MEGRTNITRLLGLARARDEAPFDRLFEVVHQRLRGIS